MALKTLVEADIRDARALLQRLDAIGFDVFAALWMHDPDHHRWTFVLGSTEVDRVGLRACLVTIQQILMDSGSTLELPTVSVVGTRDPLLRLFGEDLQLDDGEVRRFGRVVHQNILPDSIVYRMRVPSPLG